MADSFKGGGGLLIGLRSVAGAHSFAAFMALVLAIILGYLLGSIPFGFLTGKWRGIDLRREGSGNIGATNALRILGKPLGITVLALDAIKGSLACWAAPMLTSVMGSASVSTDIIAISAGFAAVLGHCYSAFTEFRGGKGVATAGGALLAPRPGLGLGLQTCSYISGTSLNTFPGGLPCLEHG